MFGDLSNLGNFLYNTHYLCQFALGDTWEPPCILRDSGDIFHIESIDCSYTFGISYRQTHDELMPGGILCSSFL